MNYPQITNPHSSTNLYVKVSIVEKNIIELNVFIYSDFFRTLNYLHKDEIRKQKEAQVSLLENLKLQVAKNEQLAFNFGLPKS